MNRKLLLLDVVLGVGVILGAIQWHSAWVAAKARQAQMPGPPLKAAAVAPMPPLPQQPAVMATGYKDIAMHDLFEPSRDPNVPVDQPPPLPPPPEPPAPPTFHGSMDLGQGPFALLSEAGESKYEKVFVGGAIGPFKLLSFNRQEFVVQWQDRVIHRRTDASDETKPQGKPQTQADGTDARRPAPGIIPGQAPAQRAATTPLPEQNLGPGAQVDPSHRDVQKGDTSPAGTVQDGYRKICNPSPMGGSQCIWAK